MDACNCNCSVSLGPFSGPQDYPPQRASLHRIQITEPKTIKVDDFPCVLRRRANNCLSALESWLAHDDMDSLMIG